MYIYHVLFISMNIYDIGCKTNYGLSSASDLNLKTKVEGKGGPQPIIVHPTLRHGLAQVPIYSGFMPILALFIWRDHVATDYEILLVTSSISIFIGSASRRCL
jgi:hypothetical protein